MMVKVLGLLACVLLISTGVMLDYSLAAKSRGAAGYAMSDYVDDRMALLRAQLPGLPVRTVADAAAVPAGEPGPQRSARSAFSGTERPFPMNVLAATFTVLHVASGGDLRMAAIGGAAVAGPDDTAAATEAAVAPSTIRQPVLRLTDRVCTARAGTKICAAGTD
jgi:hypothetical protein